MLKEIFKSSGDKKYAVYIKGMILGVFTTAAFMLVFASLMYLLKIGGGYASPFATVSLAAGSFAAAFYSAKHIGSKGYLTGMIVGLLTFALVTVISLIVDRSGLSINTLFHLIIILLSSIIGGIVGVNRNKSKKYI